MRIDEEELDKLASEYVFHCMRRFVDGAAPTTRRDFKEGFLAGLAYLMRFSGVDLALVGSEKNKTVVISLEGKVEEES